MFGHLGTVARALLCCCCVKDMNRIKSHDDEQSRGLDQKIEMQSGGWKGEEGSKVSIHDVTKCV